LFNMQTGHYTQVVWRESISLGCATTGDLLVCQYGPTGNMQGDFDSNVNGPVKSRSQCEGGGSGGSIATPTPAPQAPTPPDAGGCQDSTSFVDSAFGGDCKQWVSWVSQGFKCQDYAQIADALRQNCPVACGFGCNSSDSSPTPAPQGCNDKDGFADAQYGVDCRQWKTWVNMGYRCGDFPQLGLQANCPKACGTCSR